MMLVDTSHGPMPIDPKTLSDSIGAGAIPPCAMVSVDGGRSWMPANVALQQFAPHLDPAVGLLVPVRVEPMAMAAGYVALLSLFFLGGPLALVASVVSFDRGFAVWVRLAFTAAAIVLGPLPIALLAKKSLSNLEKNPTYQGKGRAIFALVVAALTAIPCAIALVASVVV